MKKRRVLVMAGGTGGHIFPALAVADALQGHEAEVQWLGSNVGMEKELVGSRYPMSFIDIQAVRGKGMLSKCLAPFRIAQATWQAWRIIRRYNPDCVLGMGGFAAGPGGLATWLLRKRLVVHEQNAVAGVTNRILSRLASTTLQAFPQAFSRRHEALTVGNPVRDAFWQMKPPAERLAGRQGALRILVVGGSRGARAINTLMTEVAAQYPVPDSIEIRHQTGVNDLPSVQAAYGKTAVKHEVSAFIEDMPEAYSWADLVVCRAGAMTVAELAAAGVASILIPFPLAVDDHQRFNAAYLVDQGAAELFLQHELSVQKMVETLQQFAHDRDKLVDMAQKARQCAKPDACNKILEECLK